MRRHLRPSWAMRPCVRLTAGSSTPSGTSTSAAARPNVTTWEAPGTTCTPPSGPSTQSVPAGVP
ncbi:MAG TPA: hypothetical protein VJT79_11630 [Pseudonocardia sp.]|nr:hypothetical protein [Pseudonocardia sp.]